MSRKREDKRPDRHLQQRNGNYFLSAAFPAKLLHSMLAASVFGYHLKRMTLQPLAPSETFMKLRTMITGPHSFLVSTAIRLICNTAQL